MSVNNELGKMWKEVVMTYFHVLSYYMPGGTEENYKSLRITSLWIEN
jgi:hypothetical protein